MDQKERDNVPFIEHKRNQDTQATNQGRSNLSDDIFTIAPCRQGGQERHHQSQQYQDGPPGLPRQRALGGASFIRRHNVCDCLCVCEQGVTAVPISAAARRGQYGSRIAVDNRLFTLV